MKKLIFNCLALIASQTLYSQTNTFPSSGNVGIGTNTPVANLDFYRTYGASQPKVLKMFYEGSWGYVPYASNFRFIDIASTEGGNILQVNGYGMGIGYEPPVFSSSDKLYINGNVGIGTTTPSEKLSVNGKIRAREIKVDNNSWPDFVFEKSYVLPALKSVEWYINTKGHLPGIPSAIDVKNNGINIGEMNAKLLEKIEQLTLYLIEQEKKIDAQDVKIRNIEQRHKAAE